MPVGIGRLSSREPLIMRSIQFIDQVLSAKLVLNNMRQLWELKKYLRWHKAGIVVPIFTLIVHSESNQIILIDSVLVNNVDIVFYLYWS